MLTKKHFERAAEIIRTIPTTTPENHQWLVGVFVAFFSADNPRFDQAKFEAACAGRRAGAGGCPDATRED